MNDTGSKNKSNEHQPLYHTITIINSVWIIKLKWKLKTAKYLEKKTGKIFMTLGYRKISWDTKRTNHKGKKKGKMNLIKIF